MKKTTGRTYTRGMRRAIGPSTFYLDESGSSGDLVRSRRALDFAAQPVFTLATIGVDDLVDLEDEVRRLMSTHRVRSPELKSTAVREKPGFVDDLLAWLRERNVPVFIEAVDKKFLFCVNMVNQLFLPPAVGIDLSPESMFVRNAFADFLHARIPNATMAAYAEACDDASVQATRRAYEAVSWWLTLDPAGDEVADAMRHAVAESRKVFEETASSPDGWRFGLPIPDQSKGGKRFWMLPNLSSFTNTYARINRFHQRVIAGVTLVHDEQVQFDHILEGGRIATGNLFDSGVYLSLAHADYVFEEHATLTFQPSTSSIGIQVTDVLAGFTMRFLQAQLANEPRAMAGHSDAFGFLLTLSDPQRGTGVNLVMSNPDLVRLGIPFTPSYLPAAH